MYFLYDKTYVSDPPQAIRQYFGYTLEDVARDAHVKIYGETCIPECECDVSLYESVKFGKTIIFHTEPDKRTLKVGELTWINILAHGGNTNKDTLSCVLVAERLLDKDTIQGSLKDKLRIFVEKKIGEGYTIKARFRNLTQLK